MSTRTVATPDTLNGIMEFDHVIRVHGDGTVTAELDVYAPCLDDGELDNSGWTMMGGYSGQYGYRGPVMHASEYIGGGMARGILAEPGVYVAIVANYTCTDCEPDTDHCECDTVDGWAVARLDSPAECKGACCHD